MSYNITYNPDLKKRYPSVRKNKNKPLNTVWILLAGIIAVYVLSRSDIMRYFIPGDPEITVEAFSTMVNRVGQGETVGNAVVDFCKQIIHSSR